MMVAIGRLSGRRLRAVLSDMNQPLGEAVGNAIELKEALATLHGQGPADFYEHCLIIAAHLLEMGGKTATFDEGKNLAEKVLENGLAFDKFKQLVLAQGGDVRFIDEPDRLPKAGILEPVFSTRSGYLSMVNAKIIAEATILMGAGRAKKSDSINYGVGLEVKRKVGEKIEKGQLLFNIYSDDAENIGQVKSMLDSALEFSDTPTAPLPLFYDVIQ
jgi:pyrimidine-nucleoside phosphorylase